MTIIYYRNCFHFWWAICCNGFLLKYYLHEITPLLNISNSLISSFIHLRPSINWATLPSVLGRRIASQRGLYPNSPNLSICCFMWQKRLHGWDWMKALELGGDYLGLSSWAQCSHKHPSKWKMETGELESQKRCNKGAVTWTTVWVNAGSL